MFRFLTFKAKIENPDYHRMKLMHYDSVVADVVLDVFSNISVKKVYQPNELPVGITMNTLDLITAWRDSRTIPSERLNVMEALRKIGINSSTELTTKAMALSFNDAYWLCPGNQTLLWKNINLFDNRFSEALGKAFFNPSSISGEINIKSPDSTTLGLDAKRWLQSEDGTAYLLKTNVEFPQVACNEVIASIIAQAINCNAVQYELRTGSIYYENTERECLFSVCKNFCQPEYEYITLGFARTLFDKATTQQVAEWLLQSPSTSENIATMTVLDYLIDNQDRNMHNITLIIHNRQIVGIAPAYDHGNSLWYDSISIRANDDHLNKIFRLPNKTMAERVISDGLVPNLNLSNLHNILYEECLPLLKQHIGTDRATIIIQNIDERRQWLERCIEKVEMNHEV